MNLVGEYSARVSDASRFNPQTGTCDLFFVSATTANKGNLFTFLLLDESYAKDAIGTFRLELLGQGVSVAHVMGCQCLRSLHMNHNPRS